MLDVPAPPPGDGGQLGLGVDGDREAHRLEHGQVAGGIGVGHRLLELEALGLGVVGQHQGAGLADGRELLQSAAQAAVVLAEMGADDVVEKWPQRLDHEVERAGDEQSAMSEGAVTPHAGDAGRERPGQDQMVEQLDAVGAQLVSRRSFVAPVERAQEVAAVLPIEEKQPRGTAQEIGHEPHPLGGVEVPRGEPGVGLDHVGGDERVLEVEGGQVPVGGEDVGQGSVLTARLARSTCRRSAYPGVLDDGWKVDVADVRVPVARRKGRSRKRPDRRRPGGPTVRSADRPGIGPPSRCRRRTARHSRGPGRPADGAPRGRRSSRPAGHGWATIPTTRSARSMVRVARASCRRTRPRPGNDQAGTTMGWPSAS